MESKREASRPQNVRQTDYLPFFDDRFQLETSFGFQFVCCFRFLSGELRPNVPGDPEGSPGPPVHSFLVGRIVLTFKVEREMKLPPVSR